MNSQKRAANCHYQSSLCPILDNLELLYSVGSNKLYTPLFGFHSLSYVDKSAQPLWAGFEGLSHLKKTASKTVSWLFAIDTKAVSMLARVHSLNRFRKMIYHNVL